ncbi:putative oxidoreductase SSP0419 [Fibrisoma limi BUZ 3]|uniref:Putative oxidoreductase SSP0419 n=1 Tax=Fibrisoma limi BUZ 3 TaxID=1185876 RepID=I2GTR0_9BACT|nr:SDR family NAD(P)-dependent oxidoreductase [Fibrisoma limi]CCH57290.1 putative oxidoreductase SSP0419 [Fibrisoma limi BUZ 3]
MNSLHNKIALVAGGTGGVGEGIVRTLLTEGATVIVPTRTAAKGERLREYVVDVAQDRLVIIEAILSQEDGAQTVAQQVQNRYGHLDILVASLGGWWQGQTLTQLDLKTWNQLLTTNLTSHFLAIRYLVPLLTQQTGVYAHINGFSAEQAYPKAAPVAMAAAAQKSLVMSLKEELNGTGIRVLELILGPISTRDRVRHGWTKPEYYTPTDIGQYLVDQLNQPDSGELIHRLMGK